MSDYTYTLGDVKVEVEITHVEYDPPQDLYSAASDWDCHGNLEIDWDIVSVEGGDGEALTKEDEDYIDYLLRKDIMDMIHKKDGDY